MKGQSKLLSFKLVVLCSSDACQQFVELSEDAIKRTHALERIAEQETESYAGTPS